MAITRKPKYFKLLKFSHHELHASLNLEQRECIGELPVYIFGRNVIFFGGV